MATKHSSPGESSEQAPTQKSGKMCEWSMCTQKATGVESFKGQLHELCQLHLRAIRRQKKADNNL